MGNDRALRATTPTAETRKRVRHVKTQVVHVFVIDDGETLEEYVEQPITVTAAHWPTYSGETFPAEVADFEERLNEEADAG